MSDRKKVLVIDDEPQIREALRELLTGANYAVVEAGTGQGGEKQILLENPDLVILDLMLPGRSREEILSFIQAHKPTREIPVIILSGKGTLTKKLSCYLGGAVSFIDKPYDNVKLLKTVKKYI
ncbi:MAG: response regulator [Planctomycetota bacterium]